MARRHLVSAVLFLLSGMLSVASRAASVAETVMAEMAALPSRSADFVEEKRLTSLTKPQVSSGRLIFVAGLPARLEQDTLVPHPERLIIEGNTVTLIEGDGPSHTLSLDEAPGLRALADTLRAALAGDLATLRRIYSMEQQGTAQAWRLLMVPNDLALRRVLARVTLDGAAATLRQVDVQFANGDEQRITIQSAR
jgi:hypothetical protein